MEKIQPQKKKSRDYDRHKMPIEETLRLANQYKIMMDHGFKVNKKGNAKKNANLHV
jgi:hypothetical protein